MSVVLGLRPGDTTAYRRDLSMKSSMLQQFGSDLASAGPSASRSFRTWTAAGLVVGLAGGILGAVVKDKDDAAKAGAIGSALTGAISGWLGARKYETEAARASKCKESRESAMRLFQGVWTTDNVPATDAEVKEYQTAYTKGHESIRAACAQ